MEAAEHAPILTLRKHFVVSLPSLPPPPPPPHPPPPPPCALEGRRYGVAFLILSLSLSLSLSISLSLIHRWISIGI